MECGHGKMRMNVEGDNRDRDRLSSLQDDLIHKILSFLSITDAIDASILSPRWRFIWTSMPYLNFSTDDFSTLPVFAKFVTQVLSRRNNLTQVYSVKLGFRGKVSQVFVKRILAYAFSHNIEQLNVECLHEKDIELPLSVFSSHTLKHLTLTIRDRTFCGLLSHRYFITPTSAWEFPILTTLDLNNVTLCDDKTDKCVDIFSKCVNLKNLTLKQFNIKGSDAFSISHPRLSSLTLENGGYDVNVVNVVAPQLENLTIKSGNAERIMISAPGLVSLFYKGWRSFHLSTDGFPSLEKADICVSNPQVADVHQIIFLLQQLHNAHFLTLNMEIVELLCSSMELLVHQPSPFVNLKSLKVHPGKVYSPEQVPKKVAMYPEVKSYLLDGSPGVTFTMVLPEESIAHRLLVELRVLLRKEKDNTSTNSAHVELGKAPVESHKPKSGNMAQIKGYWENLGFQIELRKEKACRIISKLQHVEELLANLPASKRAKIQPWFSSLCAEANITLSNITDCMKIKCDENRSLSSVCFHELATTLESST